MADREEIRGWVRTNWNDINTRVGACPECNEMNEDLSKLTLCAVRSGVSLSTLVGVLDFIEVFQNWPEPVIDSEAIVELHPLTVNCKMCDTEYQPERML